MTKIYGIPNCNTMKKARRWLDEHGIAYDFHNYKKDGVPEKELNTWVKQVGWEALLNRCGTTWRKLDDATRDQIDEQSAIRVMLENPSVIKRPVLVSKGKVLVSFNADDYQNQL